MTTEYLSKGKAKTSKGLNASSGFTKKAGFKEPRISLSDKLDKEFQKSEVKIFYEV